MTGASGRARTPGQPRPARARAPRLGGGPLGGARPLAEASRVTRRRGRRARAALDGQPATCTDGSRRGARLLVPVVAEPTEVDATAGPPWRTGGHGRGDPRGARRAARPARLHEHRRPRRVGPGRPPGAGLRVAGGAGRGVGGLRRHGHRRGRAGTTTCAPRWCGPWPNSVPGCRPTRTPSSTTASRRPCARRSRSRRTRWRRARRPVTVCWGCAGPSPGPEAPRRSARWRPGWGRGWRPTASSGRASTASPSDPVSPPVALAGMPAPPADFRGCRALVSLLADRPLREGRCAREARFHPRRRQRRRVPTGPRRESWRAFGRGDGIPAVAGRDGSSRLLAHTARGASSRARRSRQMTRRRSSTSASLASTSASGSPRCAWSAPTASRSASSASRTPSGWRPRRTSTSSRWRRWPSRRSPSSWTSASSSTKPP